MPGITRGAQGRGGACLFIYIKKNDSEEAHSNPQLSVWSIDLSKQTNKKKLTGYLTPVVCDTAVILTGDRRSICVFTQITTAFTAVLGQQAELSFSSSIMQLIVLMLHQYVSFI